MRSILPAAVVVAALAVAGPARAATIVGDDAAHWNEVANSGQVKSTPDWFPIRVKEAPCPQSAEATGCYMSDEFTIYLNPAANGALTPRAFYHELGHAWDRINMRPADRAAYRAMFPETANWPWLDGTTPAAGEWFAESYAWCSLDAVNPPDPAQTVYGYAPDAARHQQVCRFINTRAGVQSVDGSTPVSTDAPSPWASTPDTLSAPAAPAQAPAPPARRARKHTTKLSRCRHAAMRVKNHRLRHRKMLRCKRRYGPHRQHRRR